MCCVERGLRRPLSARGSAGGALAPLFCGVPRGRRGQRDALAERFPGGAPVLNAMLGLFRATRWVPPHAAVPPQTWVELTLDFEASTGCDVSSFAGVRRRGLATGLKLKHKLSWLPI